MNYCKDSVSLFALDFGIILQVDSYLLVLIGSHLFVYHRSRLRFSAKIASISHNDYRTGKAYPI